MGRGEVLGRERWERRGASMYVAQSEFLHCGEDPLRKRYLPYLVLNQKGVKPSPTSPSALKTWIDFRQ